MYKGSGIASFLMGYYRHIDRTKIKFDFLSDLSIPDADIFEDEINKLGGKLFKVPYYKKHLLKYLGFLNTIIRPDAYDIIHCHEFVLSILPLIVAKKNGVKIRIGHSHIHSPKSQFFSKLKELVVFLSHPFFRLFGTHFFACSYDAGIFLFGKHCPFEILYNAIDTDRFIFNDDERKNKRKELNIPNTTFVIGYVARFDKQKNHLYLIDVFQGVLLHCNNVLLLLVGDDKHGRLAGEIRKTIEDMQISDRVIIYGISDSVSELYNAMDIFVFPSRAEGLGIVGIEAQCSGLPVIASTNIPRQMQVTDLVTWLDLDDNVDNWTDAILKFSSNPLARQNMSQVITDAHYNIRIESKKLEKLYLSLAN
jgi:glycosyltransferase involved in cell wall biosynthesis